jgi:hypothetical protein
VLSLGRGVGAFTQILAKTEPAKLHAKMAAEIAPFIQGQGKRPLSRKNWPMVDWE